MKVYYLICCLTLLQFKQCNCSRILIVAPFSVTSHKIIIESVYKELLNRGHHVTIISSGLIETPSKNSTQIIVDENNGVKTVQETDVFGIFEMFTAFHQLKFIWDVSFPSLETILNTPTVKDFIENDRSHFDLVISEIFYQEALYMFAHKYKTPLILIGTSSFLSHMANFMGNPLSHAMHDCYKYDSGESIIGKLINALLIKFDKIGRKYYYLPKVNDIAKKHFSILNEQLPTIEELERNVSLILLNTHFSYDEVIPKVPGIVDIGGIHIKPLKKLPSDIQIFLDESKDGVIYFALGSLLKSSKMKKEYINAFIKVFEELKQHVIWKWEDDNPPMLNNGLLRKWLPQNDILAHPNVKLFISHCGMLGIQEAIQHSVPIIGIPIFSDQYSNLAKLITHKVALKLTYATINEDKIRNAINEILNNSEYERNMKLLSDRFKDRPNEPRDVAVYWIEYVIKYNELLNLKSSIAFMTFWEYYLIETIVIVSCLFMLSIYVSCLKIRSKVIIPKLKKK